MLWERAVRLPLLYEDSRGLRYVLYPGENAGVYLAHGGNYEVRETRFCERVLSAGMTAFDVGANIGLYTVLFAKLVGSSGAVYSFEPDEENVRRLQTNVALNDAVNVHVVPEAVYSRHGAVTLNVFPQSLNAWHSLGAPELPDPFEPGRVVTPVGGRRVMATTVDHFCAESRIERIDFLKIDVEGAEADVIRGASRMLSERRVGIVLFEVSLPQTLSLGHEPCDAFAELEAHEYRSFELRDDGRPVARGNEQPEYANYVAAVDLTLLDVG